MALERGGARASASHETGPPPACRVSARDSGKTMTDASFGEVIVTLEKIAWLCSEGERALHGWSGGSGRPWEGFGGAVDRGQLAKARVRRAASPPRLPKRRRRARAPRAGGVAGTSVTCTQSTAGASGMHSRGGSANCRRCVDASTGRHGDAAAHRRQPPVRRPRYASK